MYVCMYSGLGLFRWTPSTCFFFCFFFVFFFLFCFFKNNFDKDLLEDSFSKDVRYKKEGWIAADKENIYF